MPGKPDAHQDVGGMRNNLLGNYFPGSKEYRAWDEGWTRRYVEGELSKPNTIHDSVKNPAEFEADQAGWDAANNNSTGLCRMPATCGVPPAASP